MLLQKKKPIEEYKNQETEVQKWLRSDCSTDLKRVIAEMETRIRNLEIRSARDYSEVQPGFSSSKIPEDNLRSQGDLQQRGSEENVIHTGSVPKTIVNYAFRKGSKSDKERK